MKTLFLTSSNSDVISDVVKHIPNFIRGMRLVFIPTAAEVETGSKSWLYEDRQSLIDVGFDVSDFSITGKTTSQVKEVLDPVDIILVSGGNTYYLLEQIQKSGCAEYLQDRVNTGMIYMGSSAGSLVAGPDVKTSWSLDDPAKSPDLSSEKGLGLTDVVTFPHWGSENFKNEYVPTMRDSYAKGLKIVLLTDDQYLWVRDDWYQIMSI